MCLFVLVSISVGIAQIATTSNPPLFNKSERINKFKANFKNLTELEYIRQGLQTLRNRQNQQRSEQTISIDDIKYMEDRKILEETYDKNTYSNLKYKSIQEANKGLEEYLFEGDILLSPQEIDEMLNPRKKRQAMATKSRWNKTQPIPYFFDSNVNAGTRTLFRQAATFWSDNTCLNFKESIATPHIRIITDVADIYGSPCYARTIDGTNVLSLGDSCAYFNTFTHEIAHTLGFWHEQSRHDRDNFITVIQENMNPLFVGNSIKQTPLTNNNYGQPYDWGSVMHYPGKGDDGKFVFIAKDKIYQSTMGSQHQPSFKDLYVMNQYYNCMCATGAICQNGGFQHPKNCNICICPSGFGGAVCNQRQTAENGAIDTGAVLTVGFSLIILI
uniref:Zinc metalloproteinase n=1 Tax=Panagrolaimus sp. ES5 TaxID=591445 RepID=A0AC34GXX8_9BILA